MRPLKLSLSAFGPFPDQEVIDFTLLGQAPFFLINGPTGCGKSTILDAICYALYGATTGNERTGDQMRSDLAKADALTELAFEFELGDDHFLIERRPEQWLPKKRGEGLTRQTHSASLLQYVDGKAVTLAARPTQVNQYIVDLIGLTADQFRQVMVIPQGKFRELLLASSKDREQIFGQLFNTRIFSRLENVLAEKAADIKKGKESFDQQLQGIFDMVGVENEPQLEEAIQTLIPDLEAAKTRHRQVNQLFTQASQVHQQNLAVTERFRMREQLTVQLKELTEQQAQIDAKRTKKNRARAALTLSPVYEAVKQGQVKHEEWQQQVLNLTQLQNQAIREAEQLKETWLVAKQALTAIPDLQKRMFELDNLRAALSAVAQIQDQLAGLNGKQQQQESKIGNVRQEIEQAQQQLLTLDKEIEQASAARQSLHNKQLESEQLNALTPLFKQVEAFEKQIEKLNLVIDQKQRGLPALEQQEKQSKHSALTLEKQWLLNRAAEIALQLEPDAACPVCGSTEHPHPAQYSGEVVSKENVDLARAEYNGKLTQLNDEYAQLKALHSELQQTESELAESRAVLIQRWPEDRAAFVARQTALAEEMAELSKLNVDDLLLRQVACKSHIEQSNLDLVQLTGQMEKIKLEQAALQARLMTLRSHGGGDESLTLEAINTESIGLEQQISQLQQKEMSLAGKFREQENQVTVITTKLTNARQETRQWQETLHTNAGLWQAALAESQFGQADDYLAACLDVSQIERLEAEINQYELSLAKLNSQYEQLSRELTDHVRPDLELSSRDVELAKQNVDQALEMLTTFRSQFDALQAAKSRLLVVKEKNRELEQRYRILGTLSDVANGKNHLRISLHRFVLGVLLDDVLVQASIRLLRMSHGRYRLIRKNERSKGNASSGLDLLVEDSYTSKTRDVATLSGGESFIAALALALALSDVVQAHSGGVRLDTLFIDEGFGSLDSESLDLAIQTLLELQQGGRTIGIISHVNELKEQMQCRIDIKRDHFGSSVSLVS